MIARTESRIISDSLQRYALRLFEHVAATTGVAASRSRMRSADYAKLALVKLAAVLDAASCAQARTIEQRTRILAWLRRLEQELRNCSIEPAQRPAGDTPKTNTSKRRLIRQARRAPKTTLATVHEIVEVDCPTEMAPQRVVPEPRQVVPTGTG